MMSNQRSAFLKSLIAPLFEAMGDFSLSQVKPELEKIFSKDCLVHMCFPFNDMQGFDSKKNLDHPNSLHLPNHK